MDRAARSQRQILGPAGAVVTDASAERLVGAFLGAVGGALGLLLVIASVGDEWRNPGVHYTLVLDSGYGIAAGIPVTVRGMTVGRVESVRLTADRQVELRLHVGLDSQAQVREGTAGRAVLTLAGKVVEIGDGSSNAPMLADGGALAPGRNADPLVDLQTAAGKADFDELSRALADVRVILDQLSVDDERIPELIRLVLAVLDDVQAGRGTIGRLLKDDQVVEDVMHATKSIDAIATKLDQLAGRLDATAAALEGTSAMVTAQAKSLDGTVKSVERSSAAVQGAVEPIPGTMKDLEATLEELDRTLQAIQKLPLVRGKMEEP